MNLIDKFFIKNWCIGLTEYTAEDLIRSKTYPKEFKWIRHPSTKIFYADPFLVFDKNKKIRIFCEELDRTSYKGAITKLELDSEFKVSSTEVILSDGTHYSYPFFFQDKHKWYLLPENSDRSKVILYEMDQESLKVAKPCLILDQPLLDGTILHYRDKYWLFGNRGDDLTKSELYIYYSDNITGVYRAHPKNPVKSTLKGCRPAGAFIHVDGEIYRPSQNNEKIYGESIIIHKIINLSEDEFFEEPFMEIRSEGFNNNLHRVHTVNLVNNVMVVDATYKKFAPLLQMKRLITPDN